MNKTPGFAEAVENATDGRGDFLKVGVGIHRKATPIYEADLVFDGQSAWEILRSQSYDFLIFQSRAARLAPGRR